MTDLLSKDHRILEKGFMDYRPFGVTPEGKPIREISGLVVRAHVEYLEDCVGSSKGPDAGARAVEELCRLLNERVPDPSYHVTPSFLKNIWHSYSYEFVCFLREFCIDLSGDPAFCSRVWRKKVVPTRVLALLRPFSLPQFYKMITYFSQKFTKGSLIVEAGTVTSRSAVVRMKFTELAYQQFGSYRKRCAEISCQSINASIAIGPTWVNPVRRPPTFIERSCIADGDEWCEWEFRWVPSVTTAWPWVTAGLLMATAVLGYLHLRHPDLPTLEDVILALLSFAGVWLVKMLTTRTRVIKEQFTAADTQHEELREAYQVQERTMVEFKQKVGHLAALHEAGLALTTTRDREALLQLALETPIQKLHYDRALSPSSIHSGRSVTATGCSASLPTWRHSSGRSKFRSPTRRPPKGPSFCRASPFSSRMRATSCSGFSR